MSSSERPKLVYKVFLPDQFERFCTNGHFSGSADDQRDGFVHLSFAHQVAKTIEKHFSNRQDLVVAEFQCSDLGAQLRFEPSRDGQLFPHLYGSLLHLHVRRVVGNEHWAALGRAGAGEPHT